MKKNKLFICLLTLMLILSLNINITKAAEASDELILAQSIYSFTWTGANVIQHPGNFNDEDLAINFTDDDLKPYYINNYKKQNLISGISASENTTKGYVYFRNGSGSRYSIYAIDYASNTVDWGSSYGTPGVIYNIILDHSQSEEEIEFTYNWFASTGVISDIKYRNNVRIRQSFGNDNIYFPDYEENFLYSIDDGNTWNSLLEDQYTFENLDNLKFKNNDANLTLLFEDMDLSLAPGEISENLLTNENKDFFFTLSLTSLNTNDAIFSQNYEMPFVTYGNNMSFSVDNGNTFIKFNDISVISFDGLTNFKTQVNISEIIFKNDDYDYFLLVEYDDKEIKVNPNSTYSVLLSSDTTFNLTIHQISNKVYFSNTSDANFIVNGYNFYYQINNSGYWYSIISSGKQLPYTIENVETIKFRNNSDVYNLVFVSTDLNIPTLSPKTDSEEIVIPYTDSHITTFTFYLSIPDHEHVFVDGVCECGVNDPDYIPPHIHIYTNGICECGALDPSLNSGETGGTDIKTLIINTNIVNMKDYSQLIYYKTNTMDNYQILNISPSTPLALTDLDTIQFKNNNPNIIFIIRYNSEQLELKYGEESEILDASDIYMINASVNLSTSNEDTDINVPDQDDINDGLEDSEFNTWIKSLPLSVLIVCVVFATIVILLVFKKR